MIDGAYDDLTPEEEALLKNPAANAELPPSDDGTPTPPADEPAKAEPAAAEAPKEGDKPADAAAPAAEPGKEPAPAPAPAATEEDEFKAFMEANKGKTPEDLGRLAFNQQKRAAKEAFQGRQRHEQLQKVAERAAAALEATRASAAEQREKLAQRLKDDPDSVTKELMEQRLTAEEEVAEIEAHNTRVAAAEALAAGAIPDYAAVKPKLFEFGQEMGWTPEELDDVADGRALVTLHLARITANLIKAGVMDTAGRFLQPMGAINPQPQDPRLTAPDALGTLSSAPARPAAGGDSLEDQLQSLLNMSEEEMAKIPEAQLMELLRQAA